MKRDFSAVRRIVVKVGTSTLTYAGGEVNLRRMELLTRVLSDLSNRGYSPVLVSSGAIGAGVSKLRLPARPADVPGKQAAAAVGQCELMALYDRFFSEYHHTVGQMLLTHQVVDNEVLRINAIPALPEYGITDKFIRFQEKFPDVQISVSEAYTASARRSTAPSS